MSAAANKSTESTFSTYAEHIAEGQRGTLVMWERPSAEEMAMLVLPYTFCPNVADILDTSNWETIKRELAAVDPDGTDHKVASFGHWATPYDLMLVKAGTEAHRIAEDLMSSYADYPVLDESDFSERESEAFSNDLTDCLNQLTIVVNGVELAGDSPEYSALWCAIDQRMHERESPDHCDRSDVEETLRDLGFEYDDSELTWSGTLMIEAE
jgi:hypothetical protein